MKFIECYGTNVLVEISFHQKTGLLSLNNSGYNINHLDLAPRFSGILYGIENLAGTIPGGAAPAVTGYLTNDDVSQSKTFPFTIIYY